MIRNAAGQKITLFAFVVATNLPATGQASSLTFYVSKDDGAYVALAASPTEDDATHSAGNYSAALAASETDATKLKFSGVCGTAGVVVVPIPDLYTEFPCPAADAPDPGDLPASMLANATGPKSFTADGVTSVQHDPSQLIEMDKYLASKAAAARSPLAGVRRVRNVPPGAAGLDCDDRWRWRT